MSRICAIHQPSYLPWLGYFDKISKADVFVFLDIVQFRKNYYQNRNKIRTEDGWHWLTVPVLKRKLGQLICEVEIDSTQHQWKKKHLASMDQNYRKAPYFNTYYEGLKKEYLAYNTSSLSLLNIQLVKYIQKAIIPDWKGEFIISSHLDISDQDANERLIEICKKVNCDRYLSGVGAKDYIEETFFQKAGMKIVWQDFNEKQYKQVYEPFIPGMSAIDRMFNCGIWRG